MTTAFIKFDMESFKGGIPAGYEMVEYEEGTDPIEDGLVLLDFSEVGMFGFRNPQDAFISFWEL